MPSILFVQYQTLYAKVTIPVALDCLERGWKVYFHINRPFWLGGTSSFSEKAIKNKYTNVNILSQDAFAYVANIIGMEEEWRNASTKINFTWAGKHFPKQFDAVIGPTKDIDIYRKFAEKSIPTFLLGYQHLPIFARIDQPLAYQDPIAVSNSVFFSDNNFSRIHHFSELLRGISCRPCGFSYLDKVWTAIPTTSEKNRRVLIFHPGGYRNVISSPGDDQATCYYKQETFLEQLCLPLISRGLTPVVKVHPLRAQYHDLDDLAVITRNIEKNNRLTAGAIELLGPFSWHWTETSLASLILIFGSSAVYELWSAGVRNTFICGFFGSARSSKFDIFDSIFLETYSDYLDLLTDRQRWSPPMSGITKTVYQAYNELFSGENVSIIARELEKLS